MHMLVQKGLARSGKAETEEKGLCKQLPDADSWTPPGEAAGLLLPVECIKGQAQHKSGLNLPRPLQKIF